MGKQTNTGRTHFKKGFTPWNKGLKLKPTKAKLLADEAMRGVPKPKPKNFSEIMRKANPPIGMKKKYGSAMYREKTSRVWRDGYIMLYLPDHPLSRKKAPDYGYVLEHRKVMSEHLGRDLLKHEVIHHIDGCKSNNKIDNLLLCENSKAHGRVHERMEFFVEKLIREGKVFYDREKGEFSFR